MDTTEPTGNHPPGTPFVVTNEDLYLLIREVLDLINRFIAALEGHARSKAEEERRNQDGGKAVPSPAPSGEGPDGRVAG